MILAEEIRHLADGPRPDEDPTGVGLVAVVAECGPPATEVLDRVREVLLAVDRTAQHGWPADDAVWRTELPAWFVAFCAPEETPEEAARWLAWWRGLEPEVRAREAAARPWSVADWIHWMEPSERQWYWWHGRAVQDQLLHLTLQVQGWPFPTGALEWLLRAAGATSTRIEDPVADPAVVGAGRAGRGDR